LCTLTGKLEDYEFEIQIVEELHLVHPDCNTIALMKLVGSNSPDTQAQQMDQVDNTDIHR